MRRIGLTSEEESALQEQFKETEDVRLRERLQAVLMTARGRPRQQVMEDVGCSRSTLQRWLAAYEAGGVDALRIEWGPGRSRNIPDELTEEILGWIRGGPASCGLDRANWTHEELANHLQQTHGIEVSVRTMGNFCQRHHVRPYRPTYRYLRGDPEKQQTARQQLEVLGEKSRRR